MTKNRSHINGALVRRMDRQRSARVDELATDSSDSTDRWYFKNQFNVGDLFAQLFGGLLFEALDIFRDITREHTSAAG